MKQTRNQIKTLCCLSAAMFFLSFPNFSQETVAWNFDSGNNAGGSSTTSVTALDAALGAGVTVSGYPSADCSGGRPISIRSWWDAADVNHNAGEAISQSEYIEFSGVGCGRIYF